MNVEKHDLINQLERRAAEKALGQTLSRTEIPTIPYTELPSSPVDSPIAAEWNFYRREVGRLLAEGYEGRWLLIKGEEIVGIWDTQEEADRVRLQKYLMQHVLQKQICEREPVLRGGGYQGRWPS